MAAPVVGGNAWGCDRMDRVEPATILPTSSRLPCWSKPETCRTIAGLRPRNRRTNGGSLRHYRDPKSSILILNSPGAGRVPAWHFANSIEWMQKVIEGGKTIPMSTMAAYAVIAMDENQLKHIAQARATLPEALKSPDKNAATRRAGPWQCLARLAGSPPLRSKARLKCQHPAIIRWLQSGNCVSLRQWAMSPASWKRLNEAIRRPRMNCCRSFMKTAQAGGVKNDP